MLERRLAFLVSSARSRTLRISRRRATTSVRVSIVVVVGEAVVCEEDGSGAVDPAASPSPRVMRTATTAVTTSSATTVAATQAAREGPRGVGGGGAGWSSNCMSSLLVRAGW